MSIERFVALLTPVFSAAAGALSTGVGSATGIPQSDYIALFIAGATAAAGAALKWLHGRQKFVQFETDAAKLEQHILAGVRANQPASIALADVEQALKSHTDQIVDAIGSAVHAPPSVSEVARQVLREAAGQVATPGQASPAPISGTSASPAAV